MWKQTRRGPALAVAACAVTAIGLTLGAASPTPAQAEKPAQEEKAAPASHGIARDEARWTTAVEPMIMDAYGHDQHVLTVHRIDLGSTPRSDNKTAVHLDTDQGPAYRGKVERQGERWSWGADFLWFNSGQNAADRTAAGGGPLDQVAFEVADRTFTSSGPGEVLFYGIIEDTDLAIWTLDVYAARTLAETPESRFRLLFGLRNADFDNDYRAVVGVEGSAGSRLDASSNYDRMMGPLIAFTGDAQVGKSSFYGYLGQSVVLGNAELSGMSREFIGPFGEAPAFTDQETFSRLEDVAIPITELRVQWTYDVTRRLSLGLGADASAWWDLRVPPGVVPVADGDEALHENTIVFFGLLGAVKVRF
jgi:hypothetical protein